MIEPILAPTGFVLGAVMSWGFYVNGRHWEGNIGLVLSLVGLWTLAAVNAPHGQPLVVKPARPAVHAAELSVNLSGKRADYVASTLERKRKVYHRADCKYAPFIEHGVRFASEADAMESGYVPCQHCLSTASLSAMQQPLRGQPQ